MATPDAESSNSDAAARNEASRNGAAHTAPKPTSEDDDIEYQVVINGEQQYSIWPEFRGDPPAGWACVGMKGAKVTCLEHIDQVWTDMRPLSLRRKLAERHDAPAEEREAPLTELDPREDLVGFLQTGVHPVEVSLRPDRTAELFKAALDRGYVHLRFTDTRGGTELGVEVDRERSNLARADWSAATGSIHVQGTLELDLVPVRCVADIDLSTLSGSGSLQRASQA
jgi:uncharacterized protein YbdZ (MbtH family)